MKDGISRLITGIFDSVELQTDLPKIAELSEFEQSLYDEGTIYLEHYEYFAYDAPIIEWIEKFNEKAPMRWKDYTVIINDLVSAYDQQIDLHQGIINMLLQHPNRGVIYYTASTQKQNMTDKQFKYLVQMCDRGKLEKWRLENIFHVIQKPDEEHDEA